MPQKFTDPYEVSAYFSSNIFSIFCFDMSTFTNFFHTHIFDRRDTDIYSLDSNIKLHQATIELSNKAKIFQTTTSYKYMCVVSTNYIYFKKLLVLQQYEIRCVYPTSLDTQKSIFVKKSDETSYFMFLVKALKLDYLLQYFHCIILMHIFFTNTRTRQKFYVLCMVTLLTSSSWFNLA